MKFKLFDFFLHGLQFYKHVSCLQSNRSYYTAKIYKSCMLLSSQSLLTVSNHSCQSKLRVRTIVLRAQLIEFYQLEPRRSLPGHTQISVKFYHVKPRPGSYVYFTARPQEEENTWGLGWNSTNDLNNV